MTRMGRYGNKPRPYRGLARDFSNHSGTEDTLTAALETGANACSGMLAFLVASASGLDWAIFGSLSVFAAFVASYRLLTRRAGWGPSDT